jgi:nicotinate-nucleotide adenylyltransferase
MKIGILGGSFNPLHQGHIHLANLALKKLQLNQLWLIPTIYNPLKDKSIYLSIDDRILNCKNLTKNHPRIFVKKFSEIYTIELVKKLKSQHPNYHFYFIMGADNVENFHNWKNFSNLIKNISIAIFSRNNYLLKIRQSKAWHRYNKYKISSLNKFQNHFFSFKNHFFTTKFKSQNYDYQINNLKFFENKFSQNSQNNLPKFYIFSTKNYNISSSKIRENLIS